MAEEGKGQALLFLTYWEAGEIVQRRNPAAMLSFFFDRPFVLWYHSHQLRGGDHALRIGNRYPEHLQTKIR